MAAHNPPRFATPQAEVHFLVHAALCMSCSPADTCRLPREKHQSQESRPAPRGQVSLIRCRELPLTSQPAAGCHWPITMLTHRAALPLCLSPPPITCLQL